MKKMKKIQVKNPVCVGFTELMARYDGFQENPYGAYSTPEDAPEYAEENNNSNSQGSNAVGVLNSIFGGLTSLINGGTKFIGTWFNRGTQVNTKSETSDNTTLLLLGGAIVVVVIILLMRK